MGNRAALTNASEVELAAAVEENLLAPFRAISMLPGSELVESARLCHRLAFPSNLMLALVQHGTTKKSDNAIISPS